MESKKGKKAHRGHAHTAAAGLTAEEVRSLITSSIESQFQQFAASDNGRKILGAAASSMVVQAQAAIGTQPVKPSPAPAAESPQATFEVLEKQGKFEEAFALLPEATQGQYINAKAYAKFRQYERSGAVKINSRN